MFERFKQTILSAVPEVETLYIVGKPSCHPAMGAYAWTTSGWMDFAIRRLLIESGEWQGPGALVVVDTALCERDAVDLLGLLLHEVAHMLPYKKPAADFEPTLPQIVAQAAAIVDVSEIKTDGTIPPWHKHGLAFIRRALHLRYRAEVAGHEVAIPDLLIAGPQYGLSSAGQYRSALGNEPARCTSMSFVEIESRPTPRAFRRLFARDVLNYQRRKNAS
jgi:hypothetical protein